jgi:hypothetical protein
MDASSSLTSRLPICSIASSILFSLTNFGGFPPNEPFTYSRRPLTAVTPQGVRSRLAHWGGLTTDPEDWEGPGVCLDFFPSFLLFLDDTGDSSEDISLCFFFFFFFDVDDQCSFCPFSFGDSSDNDDDDM